jgi:hypothetical protein
MGLLLTYDYRELFVIEWSRVIFMRSEAKLFLDTETKRGCWLKVLDFYGL